MSCTEGNSHGGLACFAGSRDSTSPLYVYSIILSLTFHFPSLCESSTFSIAFQIFGFGSRTTHSLTSYLERRLPHDAQQKASLMRGELHHQISKAIFSAWTSAAGFKRRKSASYPNPYGTQSQSCSRNLNGPPRCTLLTSLRGHRTGACRLYEPLAQPPIFERKEDLLAVVSPLG